MRALRTRTESTDTYDTIDWLVKHVPNNNGKVGTWGISYPGFFAAFGMIDAHPALKAASPQAPVGDSADGDDVFHNGAFFLAANFGFYTAFKPRLAGPSRPERGPRFNLRHAGRIRLLFAHGAALEQQREVP